MGRAAQPFGARPVLETGAPGVVKEVEVNRVLIFSALFLSLLLGGCYIVTPFILNNGTESPIVLLVADELDRDTHRLKSLSTRKILPGNWSEEFGAYRPALFVFDEGKNELFAYDLNGARKAFFERYPELRGRTLTPVRLFYQEDGALSVSCTEEDSPAPPIFIVKPRKAPELLREKGEEIEQPRPNQVPRGSFGRKP